MIRPAGDRPVGSEPIYTFGSIIALWSLRYPNFGTPIGLPPPELERYHPHVVPEWLNVYDHDDVLGYPLKS